MSNYVLSCKKPRSKHDPSAAIFEDGELVFAVEEERLVREKHAPERFPRQAVEACLNHCGIELDDLDRIVLPHCPSLEANLLPYQVQRSVTEPNSIGQKLSEFEDVLERQLAIRLLNTTKLWAKKHLEPIGKPLPQIETYSHHRCHAASAFFPSSFEEALVLTIDGRGEYDSTVVWKAHETDLERIRTYEFPNSLGIFYAVITEYLGYHAFNGEGKVMGLAPYGSGNQTIASTLKSKIDMGSNYDVTSITAHGINAGVHRLEDLFGRPQNDTPGQFTDWQKDLAYVSQQILEEIILAVVEQYCEQLGTDKVCLAGGVAMNCKMNKQIMELSNISDFFVQPVANDAGLALGAGMSDRRYRSEMDTVYFGPEYSNSEIRETLEMNKLEYSNPTDLTRHVADQIADGKLIGWFQGQLEMGPRALGNRSILADPREEASRDRVNNYVKHREAWRPFAPSILEERADEYLVNAEPAPFMIKTFDVKSSKRNEIEAVIHPEDDTTRPQTVRKDQNPRYYQLLRAFEDITGVPVLLNTSFNDHGEPIVNRPNEAIKDFFSMGLDTLVLGDYVVEK